MEWLESVLSYKCGNKRIRFPLVHFDSVEYPAVAGEVVSGEISDNLELCSDFLGSVLWLDAVGLFLPFVANDLSQSNTNSGTCLCLGEGTGAIGCGLGFANFFSQIFITDLPQLLPLLKVNANLVVSKQVHASALDWMQPIPDHLVHACDVIIGCEVLYGNRSVWPALLETIRRASTQRAVVYLCVTLRNKRHDLDDFRSEYLSTIFSHVSEHPLSDNVVVLKASSSV